MRRNKAPSGYTRDPRLTCPSHSRGMAGGWDQESAKGPSRFRSGGMARAPDAKRTEAAQTQPGNGFRLCDPSPQRPGVSTCAKGSLRQGHTLATGQHAQRAGRASPRV